MTQHTVYKVPVTESERGWGRKIDDYMVCKTYEDGLLFTEEFNSKNTAQSVPDWYMQVEHNPERMTITEAQHEYLILNERVWLSELKDIK